MLFTKIGPNPKKTHEIASRGNFVVFVGGPHENTHRIPTKLKAGERNGEIPAGAVNAPGSHLGW